MMGAPVVHFEIVSQDPEPLQKFYGELFQWNIDTNNPQGYGLVDTGNERGIPGGIGGAPDPNYPGHVTFYVMVPDPQATLDHAESMGGKTLMPPTEIPGGDVTLAMLADPQGHVIGLTKA
jgi:predicted enzyme related to lactoylglutathione lyase